MVPFIAIRSNGSIYCNKIKWFHLLQRSNGSSSCNKIKWFHLLQRSNGSIYFRDTCRIIIWYIYIWATIGTECSIPDKQNNEIHHPLIFLQALPSEGSEGTEKTWPPGNHHRNANTWQHRRLRLVDPTALTAFWNVEPGWTRYMYIKEHGCSEFWSS